MTENEQPSQVLRLKTGLQSRFLLEELQSLIYGSEVLTGQKYFD